MFRVIHFLDSYPIKTPIKYKYIIKYISHIVTNRRHLLHGCEILPFLTIRFHSSIFSNIFQPSRMSRVVPFQPPKPTPQQSRSVYDVNVHGLIHRKFDSQLSNPHPRRDWWKSVWQENSCRSRTLNHIIWDSVKQNQPAHTCSLILLCTIRY